MKRPVRTLLPRRVYEALTWPTLSRALRVVRHAPECAPCGGKKIWTSQARARIYIGLLLRTTPPKPDGHTFAAYVCPFGNGWHVGRNQRAASLLRRSLS